MNVFNSINKNRVKKLAQSQKILAANFLALLPVFNENEQITKLMSKCV